MKTLVALFAIILSATTWARGESIQYGFAPSLSFMSVSDPSGSTDTSSAFSAISGVVKYTSPWRYTSWISQIGYSEFEHKASQTQIGQISHVWDFAGGIETRYAVSRQLEIFPAALIGISQAEHASRHTVDSEGYLKEKLDKRSASEPFFKVQASYYGRLSRKWDWGVVPQYQYSLGDGYSGFILGAQFLYR